MNRSNEKSRRAAVLALLSLGFFLGWKINAGSSGFGVVGHAASLACEERFIYSYTQRISKRRDHVTTCPYR